MRSLSFLSSLKADIWALVRLGLGGWEDLRTLLTSALSSSASCWLSLIQAASMAVMYSKLGGCLGVTAKLGPLARTDLWAGVKGLLERLMTHLGLGSSLEEPWGCLAGGAVGLLPSGGVVLTSWEAWEGLCLGGCLLPCLRLFVRLLVWPACVLEGLGCLLPSGEGRRAMAWEEWGVLAWGRLVSSPGGVAPAWGGALPSPAWLLACKGAGEVLASLGGDLPGKNCCLPRGSPGRFGLPDCWLENYDYDYNYLD